MVGSIQLFQKRLSERVANGECRTDVTRPKGTVVTLLYMQNFINSVHLPWKSTTTMIVCLRVLDSEEKRNALFFQLEDFPRFLVWKAYCWFSHDVTKIQTTKLWNLPRFYFHDVLEHLKHNFHTNFRFKTVLGFVIEYAWISKLLRDAAFTWRPRELSCRLKKWLISGNFAI